MSALGHKRTNHRRPKSDFVHYCPKADSRWRGCFVRLCDHPAFEAWRRVSNSRIANLRRESARRS